MNVGILTFHFSDNYGAALQAYALRRWMTEQGHHASFIDYRPAHIEHGGSLCLPTSPARLKANLKVVYLAVSSFIHEHFGNQSQKEKFVRFREQFLGLQGDAAPTDNGASLAAAQSFDLIVAGSDQIWSPSQHFGFDANYFLAFAQRFPARKISYAASSAETGSPRRKPRSCLRCCATSMPFPCGKPPGSRWSSGPSGTSPPTCPTDAAAQRLRGAHRQRAARRR